MQQPKDKKEQDEQTKAIIQSTNETNATFQRVFNGKDGELVLKEIENHCRIYNFLIDYNHPDPLILAANAAKRDVWDFIQNALDEKRVAKNIERYKKTLSKEKP